MKVGDYNILRQIASGGMAEVYLAEKQGVGGFHRRVILKKLLPKFTEDPAFVEMFYNEAILVSNLNHPNIVQVYDVIRNKFEIYIAMEYVDGPGLSMVFRHMRTYNMPMSFPMVARVVADVARALDHAYNAKDDEGRPLNIIHRDVTPSNIMINKTGVVKLVDFGIAKASFTDDQAFVDYVRGKPAYMAPELFNRREVSHQSDIFSLGVVLFELTTGHRLFKRKDPVSTVRAVLRCHIPPPTKLVQGYPGALEAVINRAVTKDPENRYKSAADMANDLETYISSTPKKRVDNSEVAEFIRNLMTKGTEKSFEEMTIDDFVLPDGVPSITTTSKAAALTTDSYSSSTSSSTAARYDGMNLDEFIASLGHKQESKRTSRIIWINGFLVALVGFVLVYLLFLRPKPVPKPIAHERQEPPKVTRIEPPVIRPETSVDIIRTIGRRPLWAFFELPGTANHGKQKKTGMLSMQLSHKARIYIDRKRVGTYTKLELNLPVGKHKLLIKSKGYKTFSKRIRIRQGKKIKLGITLVSLNPVKQTKPANSPQTPPVQNVQQTPPANETTKPTPQKVAMNAPPPAVQPMPKPQPPPPPKPVKKVPHLGFAMSVIRQVGVILNVLAHDQGKFSGISTIKTAVVCDDDPYSKQKAQVVFSKMHAVSGRTVAGKRIVPTLVVYQDADSLRSKLRSMHIRLVYIVPMDRKDVRGALHGALRAGAATVTGIAGYQHVGVCLSVGRKASGFALIINKRRCKAEGVRFDEKILNLADVY